MLKKTLIKPFLFIMLLIIPSFTFAGGSYYPPSYSQIPSYDIVDINNRFSDQLRFHQDPILNPYDVLDRQFHFINEYPGAGYYAPPVYAPSYYPAPGFVGNDHYTGPGFVGNDHFTGSTPPVNRYGNSRSNDDYYRGYDDSYYR